MLYNPVHRTGFFFCPSFRFTTNINFKDAVSEQTINSIESKRLWPRDKTLVKITGALEIDVVQLFFPDSENALSKLEIQGDLSNIVVSSVRSLVEETLKQYTKI